MKAPATVSLRVCPVCGRTDRYTAFTGKSHFFRGDKCAGTPETVEYILASVPSDRKGSQ